MPKATVGPDGAKVELNGCALTFQPGTFDSDTLVHIEVTHPTPETRLGYQTVTPVVNVNHEKPLLKPVTVQLPILDFGLEQPNAVVHIFHQPDGSAEPEIITQQTLKPRNKISFECSTFSPIWGAIRKAIFGERSYVIGGYLFLLSRNEILLAFYIENEIIKASIRNEAPVKPRLLFSPFLVHEQDNVGVCLRSSNENATWVETHFIINESFLSSHKKLISLAKREQIGELIEVLVQKNDEEVQAQCCYNGGGDDDENAFQYKETDSRIKGLYTKQPTRESMKTQIITAEEKQVLPMEIEEHQGLADKETKYYDDIHKRKEELILVQSSRSEEINWEIRNEYDDISGGQKINVEGCRLVFHEGSFNEPTKVSISVNVDKTNWPPGYIAISPIIDLDFEKELQKPVEVSLPTWCMNPGSRESGHKIVNILHKSSKKNKWEVIKTLPFDSSMGRFTAQFCCIDFSPIVVVIPDDSAAYSKEYLIAGIITNQRGNLLETIFYMDNESWENRIFNKYKSMNREVMCDIDPITLRHCGKVSVTIDSEVFQCQPESVEFTLDKNFIKGEKKSLEQIEVLKPQEGKNNAMMNVSVKVDGEHFSQQKIQYKWKDLDFDSDEKEQSPKTVYNANTVVQGIMEQNNKDCNSYVNVGRETRARIKARSSSLTPSNTTADKGKQTAKRHTNQQTRVKKRKKRS